MTSLIFISNKKIYGPYGSTKGLGFETIPHGKVLGFYGRATSYLHNIRVFIQVEDLPNIETIDVVGEAWGGQGGDSFYDGKGDVIEVLVSYNDRHVVSLQTTYKHGGKIFKANQDGGHHGGGDGVAKEAKVRILT